MLVGLDALHRPDDSELIFVFIILIDGFSSRRMMLFVGHEDVVDKWTLRREEADTDLQCFAMVNF